MPVAYIGLGSNLGDRAVNLRRALELLHDPTDVRVVRVSPTVEWEPIDCPPGSANFLNAAAIVDTELPPRQLLERMLEVETRLGRTRDGAVRFAPRPIDLDLLLFDDQVVDEPGLKVPHPALHERGFVLKPLAVIASGVRHPTLGLTIGELWQRLEAETADQETTSGGSAAPAANAG